MGVTFTAVKGTLKAQAACGCVTASCDPTLPLTEVFGSGHREQLSMRLSALKSSLGVTGLVETSPAPRRQTNFAADKDSEALGEIVNGGSLFFK